MGRFLSRHACLNKAILLDELGKCVFLCGDLNAIDYEVSLVLNFVQILKTLK